MEFLNGLVWMHVEAPQSSQPLLFLLDSGASISVLDTRTAKDLGLPRRPRVTVQAVGSIQSGFGPVTWEGQVQGVDLPSEYLILDLRHLAEACGRPIDGLIGADFFRNRIVEIDYRAEKVRILDSPPDASQTTHVPLAVGGRGFSVEASVNQRSGQCLRIDTGCATAVQWVSADTPARTGPGGSAVGLSKVSVPQTLTGVRLGVHHFDTVPTGLHRQPIFQGETGLLGNGLLAMFGSVVFDLRARRMHLAPATDY